MTKITDFESLPAVMGALDVAAALGVSKNTAYQLLHSEGFPCLRVGARLLVSKPLLLGWIEKQSRQSSGGEETA